MLPMSVHGKTGIDRRIGNPTRMTVRPEGANYQ
jgi:hypothetical protein